MSALGPACVKTIGHLNHRENVMADHILGQSRTQTTLLPEVLDDFVTEDNPVRVVDGLDL